MRLPNAEHESRPWRIREIARDFTLEDVWALPAYGRAEDFDALLELMATGDPEQGPSLATRLLWQLRWLLGRVFGLDEPSEALPIPGTQITSLSERLPQELRGTVAGMEFERLPFTPVYRTDSEFAAEISNKTVHGVLHLAWVELADGGFQGQMAVYVKPRGALGKAYMELIKPFRHAIVYPALMRQIERTWNARSRRARGASGQPRAVAQ
jgi:hypothetical protein